MKTVIFMVVLVAAVAAPAAATGFVTAAVDGQVAAAPGPTRARVVTYNIAGNHKSYNEDRIVQVLASLSPDVVLLQEVSGSVGGADGEREFETQAHAIAARLRMSCAFGQAHQTRVFGNAVLSRWPMHNATVLDLPHGSIKQANGRRMPGATERRAAVAVTVCPDPARPELDFLALSVHLGIYTDADRASGVSDKPVRIIRDYVNRGRKAMPALLGGDLNAQLDTPTLRAFDRNWNLHVPAAGTGGTFNTRGGMKKIDHVLWRGRGVWRMGEQRALTFDESRHASDHCPLLAVWHVK